MPNLQTLAELHMFGLSLLTAVRGVEYVVWPPTSYMLLYTNICSLQYAGSLRSSQHLEKLSTTLLAG